MNRKLNLKGRIALVTSILSLALLAPITTSAQPNAKPESGKYTDTTEVHECAHCRSLHSTKGDPCPHEYLHSSSGNGDGASLVGFAEVDPAAGLFDDRDSDVVASSHQVSREYVGFAEVDPADFGEQVGVIIPQLVERSVWQNPVGFVETDPAKVEGVTEVILKEIFVACQHMGTSSLNPPSIDFSLLSSLEDHS